jgi:superfamily I DNA/RNA helicase
VPLQTWRPEISKRPTIVALPIPRPYGDWEKIVNFRIDESLPDAAGALIEWLMNTSGWTVEEDGATVSIRPRHICILFRRFRNYSTDVTRPYVRALETRRIPHVLVGGRSFHDREEVLALRYALAAIEWPDDELRVYAALRGPMFALGDDALFAYRQCLGADGELGICRLHPMHPVDHNELDPTTQQVADALALMGRLHVGRNHRPIAQTILMLPDAVRAHAAIAMWPTGEQALANCLRMVDLARQFERRGASSFRAFVERMDADAEARRGRRTIVCSGGNVLTASSFGSGGEIGHQLYNELGAGKLDSVDFQSVPTDEAKRAGYFLWRLDAALATLE